MLQPFGSPMTVFWSCLTSGSQSQLHVFNVLAVWQFSLMPKTGKKWAPLYARLLGMYCNCGVECCFTGP